MTATCTGAFPMEQSLVRQLVAFAKAGDAEAFEKIVILNERMVLRVAQRLLLNAEDAKDAAQDVFLRLHKSLRHFDELRDLAPWLYRMTVNICRDHQRVTRQALPLDGITPPATTGDPERDAVAAEQHRLVWQSLAILSPREREAVVLRDLEGHSTQEVAALLNSSETTVRSQLSTGRAKMRTFLTAKWGPAK